MTDNEMNTSWLIVSIWSILWRRESDVGALLIKAQKGRCSLSDKK